MTDQDIDAIFAEAQLARREVKVCTRPDLVEEYRNLAGQDRGDSLSDKGRGKKLAELVAQIEAKTVTFVFQALPPEKYRALLAKHPPTPGNKGQERIGYNIESFVDALIQECLVSPKLTEKQWSAVRPKVSQADWDAMQAAAHSVSAIRVEVPF